MGESYWGCGPKLQKANSNINNIYDIDILIICLAFQSSKKHCGCYKFRVV